MPDTDTERAYDEREPVGRIYANLTDDGIELSLPDAEGAVMAATQAATLVAENIEGRYGEDAELAGMLRTAARFGNDVLKLDTHNDDACHAESYARGQFVDVILLGQAAAFYAEQLRRDGIEGGDPEDYQRAAEAFAIVWADLFRPMGIQAIGGRLEVTEHRYSTEG